MVETATDSSTDRERDQAARDAATLQELLELSQRALSDAEQAYDAAVAQGGVGSDAALKTKGALDHARATYHQVRNAGSSPGTLAGLAQQIAVARAEVTAGQGDSFAVLSERAMMVAENYEHIQLSAQGRQLVAARMDAIMNNDAVAYANSFVSEAKWLPPALRQEVRNSLIADARLPENQQKFAQVRGSPYGRLSAEKIKANQEYLEKYIKDATTPEARRLGLQLLESRLYAFPQFESIRTRMEHRENAQTILNESHDLFLQHYRTQATILTNHRTAEAEPMLKQLAHDVSPELGQRLLSKDKATSSAALVEVMDDVSHVNIEDANREIARAGGDPSKMLPAVRRYFDLRVLLAAHAGSIALDGQVKFIEHYQDLKLKIDSDKATEQEIAVYKVTASFLHAMDDTSISVGERAMNAIGSAQGAELAAKASRLGLSSDYAVGIISIRIAYAQQHGGIETYYDMVKKAKDQDPAAQAYMADYFKFAGTAMGVANFNGEDMGSTLFNRNIEQLGHNIQSHAVEVTVGADGQPHFFDKNTLESSAVYGGNKLSFDYSALMQSLYKESREPGADPEFVAIVRHLDTYRLHNESEARALIDAVAQGKPLAEVRTSLDAIMTRERQGMAKYAPAVLTNATTYQQGVLAQYTLLDANGSLDVDRLLQTVEAMKIHTYPYYKQHLQESTASLLASGDKDLILLAESRAISEVATKLRGLHSLEHITERLVPIYDAVDKLQAAHQPIPTVLQQEITMMQSITEYDPRTATTDETAAFEANVTKYLKGDSYIAEKEAADKNKPESDRSNIVADVMKLTETRLRTDPHYLMRGEEDAVPAVGSPTVSTPVVPAVGAPTGQPTVPVVPAVDWNSKSEREGMSGALDGWKTDKLEAALQKVLGAMPIAERMRVFGSFAAVQAANVGDKNYLSYNELETAVRSIGITNPEQLAAFDTAHIVKAFQQHDVSGGQTATGPAAVTTAPNVLSRDSQLVKA